MSLVSVDVEATGLDTGTARVIEIGMVRFERGQVADRWNSLVDPGVPIPEKVTKITGITDEMVKGQPSFRDLKWEVYGRLRDRIFVAYNAPYDQPVIEAEMGRVGLNLPPVPVLDPLVWARQFMPTERRHNLGAVCAKFGIPLDQAHRAEHDAEAAGRVLLRLADKVPLELGALLREQKQWIDDQEAAFEQRRAARQARIEAEGGKLPTEPEEPEEPEDISQTGLFA
jgi:DNA polymerase III epsilon subunit family exonuclease